MPQPADPTLAAPEMESIFGKNFTALYKLTSATQTYVSGLMRYAADFFVPYLLAVQYFQKVESDRLLTTSPLDSLESYLKLLEFNFNIFDRGFSSGLDAINAYGHKEMGNLVTALFQSFWNLDSRQLDEFATRQAQLMERVVHAYPQAIKAIEPEYGFHFERGQHELVAQSDRFYLYRIAPSDKGVAVRMDAKPVCIIPPYVLGANILGFLPGERRSYAHSFANQGFPTYIRILKDISTTVALQLMTAEDDVRDTRSFCETILKLHGKPVTLNGYCQGGYNALCNLLSGELDGLVDAFITCVAPMDGTRSKGLSNFLKRLPQRFNDLAYGTKTLANGNQVADGKLMGWVYKLKSIETEQPLTAFYRDLILFSHSNGKQFHFSKTAAALNYWLSHERNDLPLEITRVSFASYNVPITKDGTLPVQLFGRKLNLKRIVEKRIPWLICYGLHDDLVEKETALAPLDYVRAEVTPFPKGHVAIATSWSDPQSACALHTRFGEGKWRGPVLFHMELDQALDSQKAANETPKADSTPVDAPYENLPANETDEGPSASKAETDTVAAALADEQAPAVASSEENIAKPAARKRGRKPKSPTPPKEPRKPHPSE